MDIQSLIENIMDDIENMIYDTKYNDIIDILTLHLQKLQKQTKDEKEVECWRNNCECGYHCIKGKYNYCPKCGAKIKWID